MTSFETQALCGNVIGSMVGKDKGDVSNRTRCAGAQLKNNAQTLAADTVVIGAGAGTIAAAKKMPKFQSAMVKIFDKIGKHIYPLRKRAVELTGKYGTKFKTFELTRGVRADKLLKAPGMAKVAAIVALPVTLALGYLENRRIYKSGQIDQKYTDRAKLEKHDKEII